VSLDTVLSAVVIEDVRHELTTTISVESPEAPSCFRFCPGLEPNDGRRSLILRREEHKPHESAFVIDGEQKHALATRRLRSDRPTQVRVHQL